MNLDELYGGIDTEFRKLTAEKEKDSVAYLESKGWKRELSTPFTTYWTDPTDGKGKKTDFAMFLQKQRDGEIPEIKLRKV